MPMNMWSLAYFLTSSSFLVTTAVSFMIFNSFAGRVTRVSASAALEVAVQGNTIGKNHVSITATASIIVLFCHVCLGNGSL
jgi:hypothetical protein